MALKPVSCVSVDCDDCGDGWADADTRLHFADEAEAQRILVALEWRRTPGGEWLCPPCRDHRECEQHGHYFNDWRPCRCGGRIEQPGHGEICEWEFRACQRCSEPEHRPIPPAPPSQAAKLDALDGIERTPARLHMLRACQRGGVQWSITCVPSLSPWVLDGVRLLVGSPDAVALDELAGRSLTHEGQVGDEQVRVVGRDSQTITTAGAALLREWSR